VQVEVDEKGTLPYAADPKQSYWVPFPQKDGIASPFITMAVLYPTTESATTVLEMRWQSMPADPPPGVAMGHVVTLATLIDSRDIFAITRVVDVPPPLTQGRILLP
jgi:hypothetical protein